MAFWGIEVKPGKPFTHSFDKLRGRLHISQATLAIGTSNKTSLVQCNVGNKIPVLLCALLPDKTESLPLNLEFEEAEDVVFSVIGPRGVYLTGYYLGQSRHSAFDDESESFGEDIANTDTEGSIPRSEEDEYEGSFIDDDELEVLPPSPVSTDGVEEVMDANKPMAKKHTHKRLKKKYKAVESDEDTSSWQLNTGNCIRSLALSDDEDSLPISSICKNKRGGKEIPLDATRDVVTMERVNTCKRTGAEDDTRAKSADGDAYVVASKREVEALVKDDETKSKLSPANGVKSKKKRKERSKEGGDNGNDNAVIKQNKSQQTNTETENMDHDLLVRGERDKGQTKNMQIALSPESLVPSLEVNSGDVPNKKRRRKEKSVVKSHDSDALGEERAKQDEVKTSMGSDLHARNEQVHKPSDDKKCDIITEQIADENLSDKKTIKKKSKSKIKEDDKNVNVDVPILSKKEKVRSIKESEGNNVDVGSSQARTLSNGLTIEELESGRSDGKAAALGKKLKVLYTAKLKESGQVIETNVGKAPYKFRLGDQQVIEGWTVGLDGMRVGGKRRLIIPPSMAYGSHATVENIPPNSWLVYDIELMSVH